ncbi:hypothetical protein [Agromyces aerolatus]|uniref:hypothetical protein n=1 Tax=Agromyces sp. LY-1074 TaxID=3074080 RepID=UPI002866E5B1|nr:MULTISPECIES: hypothetical protein [unclassified Agromyces]MDR5698647.1 hypothetical protein [Agromyces sp. LY-1074]MDR5704941.1 hypothetical protein [Agromyces sp. LY-1358]
MLTRTPRLRLRLDLADALLANGVTPASAADAARGMMPIGAVARPDEWQLGPARGSWVCDAPIDPWVPSLWYELTVPAGVTEVEIEALGSGAGSGTIDPVTSGTRVRTTVPARAGERLSVRTSSVPGADGGSEVTFASGWADRWVFASGGERRGPSWGPVGAVIEERVHAGPGRVTISWGFDQG